MWKKDRYSLKKMDRKDEEIFADPPALSGSRRDAVKKKNILAIFGKIGAQIIMVCLLDRKTQGGLATPGRGQITSVRFRRAV